MYSKLISTFAFLGRSACICVVCSILLSRKYHVTVDRNKKLRSSSTECDPVF